MDERNQKNTLYYTKIAIRRYFGNANYRYKKLSLNSKKAEKGQQIADAVREHHLFLLCFMSFFPLIPIRVTCMV